MGRKRSVTLEAEWRSRLARFEKSSLTIVDFCEREGVSTLSFYQWRQRLEGGSPRRSKRGRQGGARKAAQPAFVPIHVSSASVAEIDFPNGVRVRVPAGDSEALRAALRIGNELLGEPRC